MKPLLTPADFEAFREVMRDVVRQENDVLRSDFSVLQTSIDGYLKRTEDWRFEQKVLRQRVKRLEDLLLRKQLVAEDELG